jgi:hypothetical protein
MSVRKRHLSPDFGVGRPEIGKKFFRFEITVRLRTGSAGASARDNKRLFPDGLAPVGFQ